MAWEAVVRCEWGAAWRRPGVSRGAGLRDAGSDGGDGSGGFGGCGDGGCDGGGGAVAVGGWLRRGLSRLGRWWRLLRLPLLLLLR